ncbi:four-helix bundle copper-binding protein [Winogradskyella forsetii]|uniref:four-helix bundle copper-binding protein n=1 Tax=Winogradskyella forsetii TaxID=2686077 RepID=UPI0021195328|nr:four-helix bundle copper-binding protein [Winogradskyella forsetii]
MSGQDSKNDCPKCCVECMDACDILIKKIASNSTYVKQYALLCAEICEYCADHCEAHDHEHCKNCAASCKACAEECKKIAA